MSTFETNLRFGDRYGIFHHNPLNGFVAGRGGKGAFVCVIGCVLGNQVWNKCGQWYAASRAVAATLEERHTNKRFVKMQLNIDFRGSLMRYDCN